MANVAGQAASPTPRETGEIAPGAGGGADGVGRWHGARGLYLALQLLAGLALVLSWVFPAAATPTIWVCPFERFLHLPCPGCGLTRAFCAIGHGEFAAAWAFNPFGYVFYGGAVAALVWPFVARWRPQWEQVLLRGRAVTIGALLLVSAMWVFGLARLVGFVVSGGYGPQPGP